MWLVIGDVLFNRISLVAFGAREIEDELGRLFGFLFLDGALRMEKLIGDEGEDRCATRGNATLGHLDEKTGEEFVDVLSGREFGETAREEINGEVGGVTGRLEDGGAKMAGTETRVRG